MRKFLLFALPLLLAAAACTALLTGPARAGAPYSCSGSTLGNPGYTCGPYPGYTAWSPGYDTGSLLVTQDAWGPVPGETQTLYANSPGDWQAVNDAPAGNTAVTTYPNAGARYSEAPLSSFPQIISSYSASLPSTAGSAGWGAYDLWFDNWQYEVMIQFAFAQGTGEGRCGDYLAAVPFGGSNGVPAETWEFCTYGSELIFQPPAGVNRPADTVDIKAMISWLVSNGHMAANPTVTALSAGFEICSTGGQPEPWTYSNLTMDTGGVSPTPSPTPTSPSPTPTSPSPSPTSPSPSPTMTSPSPSPSTSSPPPGTALLGDTSVAPALDSNPQGTAQAYPYTAQATGTSATASFYVDPLTTATAGDIGIYDDDGWGNPGHLLGQAAFTPQAGWDTVTLPGVPVTAGQKYWIAELGTSAGTLAYRDGGPPGAHGYSETSGGGLTSLPASWGSSNGGTRWDGGVASAYVSG